MRGRSARQVRQEQLPRAAAMRPDLATVVAGMNDLVGPRFAADAAAAEVEVMQRALVGAGATVLTFTLPDLAAVIPIARPLSSRVHAFNDALRRASARTGAILVDVAVHDSASDWRLWSEDRLHASPLGHAYIAAAPAHAIGLPGADDSWTRPLPAAAPRTASAILSAEIAWWRRYFLPWVVRHARGRSSGDGRQAKRPELTPFAALG